MYLFAALCLCACFALGWLTWPSQRAASLLSALLLAPFGLLGAVFVPTYWQPDHCFTLLHGVGPEDVLFCFGIGGLSWLAAAGGYASRWHVRPTPATFLVRFGAWVVGSLTAVLTLHLAGWSILPAAIGGFSFAGLVVLALAPRVRRMVLPGAVGFATVYALVGWLVLWICPQSARFWMAEAICGPRVFGLPIEEIIWAFSFGAVWPAVVGYCLEVQSSVVRGQESGVRSQRSIVSASKPSELYPLGERTQGVQSTGLCEELL